MRRLTFVLVLVPGRRGIPSADCLRLYAKGEPGRSSSGGDAMVVQDPFERGGQSAAGDVKRKSRGEGGGREERKEAS